MSTHRNGPTPSQPLPACPMCGSAENVVRMAGSLTPFERPDMYDHYGARYYCRRCAHDFTPEQAPEE